MADKTEFLQAIDDAILDADSLERFINGSDSETVLTRLSAEYPTLQKALKELFENGGLPATPFETKALMEASALVDGKYAMVTNDADNNGLYVKTAGAWVKSDYDPLAQAKAYVDSSIVSIHKPSTQVGVKSEFSNAGGYDSSGTLNSGLTSTFHTALIAVKAGDILTLRTTMSASNYPVILIYNSNSILLTTVLSTTGSPTACQTFTYTFNQNGYFRAQYTNTVTDACADYVLTTKQNILFKEDIKNGIVPLDAVTGYIPTNNLFKAANVSSSGFIHHANGVYRSNTDFPHIVVSEYIPVLPNTAYYFNSNDVTSFAAEYTELKAFVKGHEGRTYNTFTTSPTTKFIRVNINKNSISLDDFAINVGSTYTAATPDSFTWLNKAISTAMNGYATPSLDRFKDKNLLVSGDSITEKNYHTAKPWHGFLKDWLGFGVVQNDGKSGTGLVKPSGSVVGTNYRIPTWKTKYNDPDLILIMGNMNDGTSDASGAWDWIYGAEDAHKGDWTTIITAENMNSSLWFATRYFCEELLRLYPNTPIGWVSSTPRSQTAVKSGTARLGYSAKCWGQDGWYSEWLDVITEVCGHYSIPVLDIYHQSNMRPWIAENNAEMFSGNDGIHPNIKGHEIMANRILPFVEQFM